MLIGFLWLLVCLLIGELISRALDIPVPGSVIGMLVLLIALMIRGGVPEDLRLASEGVLKLLPLFLVPAGVGLVEHWETLYALGWQIVIVLFISTLVAMVVTALVIDRALKKRRKDALYGVQ